MSDSDALSPPVTARTRRSRRISLMWLIPILAVVIGAWLAWDAYSKRGPTITVAFPTGEGLTAGQSQLKFKDIVFGTVQSLDVTPDNSHVLVQIATTSRATPLLTDQTVFWVAKPRLFAGNISGIETLVSGNYVAMQPGARGGKPKHDFVGQSDPPILTADMPPVTRPEHHRRQARRALRPRHPHRPSHRRVRIDRQRARPYHGHGESPPQIPSRDRQLNRARRDLCVK